MSAAEDVLRQRFGFDRFRPGQEAVIGHLLAGRSAAAVFPTGSGKSLCYQLPALLLPGLTLVVSPLIALMKDQIDRLQGLGIPAARLDSTLTAEEAAAIMNAVYAGTLRLLYVAPERFNNERFRAALARVRVALFAVDEAHCISEWGHNFRPDYLKLTQFGKECRAERVLALTATATPPVLRDVCRAFGIAPECAVRTGFYRPNLTVRFTPIRAAERDAALVERLRSRPPGATIVYVTLQRTAEAVAARLADAGFPARAYHAGMKTEERSAVQEWFAASDRAVVVATIAFGMGIDKADIRAVYHYNLPKSLENFSQEIGRAGRDSLPSTCEMFVCPDDLHALENFAYGDTPGPDAVLGLVQAVFSRGEEFAVSLTELADELDIRPLVLNTLLTYLELDGYLREGTAFYASYQFQPLASSQEILAKFEGERRTFLATLFRQAKKAKVWFSLDLEEAARAAGAPRERVVRALEYLAEQRLLELKTSGVRNRFRRLRQPDDPEGLAADLHRRTLEREAREIARLEQVLELAGHDGCQVSRLGEHFGEPLPQPCGHCSRCLDGRPAALLSRPPAVIDEATWRQACAVRAEHPDPLAEPRALARFLCGLTSPRLTRNRLTRHPLFGSLAHVPFAELLRRAG
ncbi:MAG TPA: ATP-dependent DNA helicase RecQ, partial [Gemmataceae bacterium]|nr:ATP-dependent DNA helicase RecQ [Gemmataceae bacterium]